MRKLSGRVALITGGAKGIGWACTAALAESGAACILTYRSRRDLAVEAVRGLREAGADAEMVRLDLADRGSVDDAVAFAESRRGRIDILVNNAGIWNEEPRPLVSEDDRSLEDMLSVNLAGAMRVSRSVLPVMLRHRYGRIVFIGSTAGVRGEAGHSAYAAAKGALVALARSLTSEVACHGITANVVAPGWVYTDMTRSVLTPDTLADIESQIPTGRITRPEEVAAAVRFLSLPEAAQITGVRLDVNGGAVFG